MSPLRRWSAAALGLCLLSAGIIWVGPLALLDALAGYQILDLVLVAMAVACGSLLGALNCYRIAELRPVLSFGSFVPVFWRAWAIGLSVPGQVGDLLSTLWQLRGKATDIAFVAGRLLTDKAVTLGCMLMLASCLPGLLGVTHNQHALLPPAIAAMVLVSGSFAARWLALRPRSAGTPGRLRTVLEAVAAPWPQLLSNAGVTAGKIILTGSAYWLLLTPERGSAAGFFAITAISQSAALVAYVPISFNGIGTVELSAVQLFGWAGYAAPKVLSAYLVLRLCTLVVAWLPVGILFLLSTRQRAGGHPDAR